MTRSLIIQTIVMLNNSQMKKWVPKQQTTLEISTSIF